MCHIGSLEMDSYWNCFYRLIITKAASSILLTFKIYMSLHHHKMPPYIKARYHILSRIKGERTTWYTSVSFQKEDEAFLEVPASRLSLSQNWATCLP